MKLIEYWRGKDCEKLVVRHWGRRREYFRDIGYSHWRDEQGFRVWNITSDGLDDLLWVAQRREKLQLHKIAFDQLTSTDSENV